ncbi:MAG TPA: hypothetical protein VG326_16525 [Tepidisphaeraceae bacterium]|jgi:hypothetical protein|nr:hypothetical protein [Tepidisphaeraceae bacterium]
MLKYWIGGGAVLSIGLLAGCHGSSSAQDPAPPPAAEAPKLPIPSDSPFARVKIGMSREEVFATIGPPTSIGSYQTGKAWIPYNFGGDKYRLIGHYKGIGNIIFSQDSSFTSGTSVIEINYDPEDKGF